MKTFSKQNIANYEKLNCIREALCNEYEAHGLSERAWELYREFNEYSNEHIKDPANYHDYNEQCQLKLVSYTKWKSNDELNEIIKKLSEHYPPREIGTFTSK